MVRCALRCALAVILAVGAPCCDSGRGEAQRTIFSFVDAVQTENLDSLHCLLARPASLPDRTAAGAHRRDFDDWARSRYAAYLVGRDRGGADLGADGIVLTKALALGRGAFYDVAGVRRNGDTLVANAEVRLGYGSIDTSVFPPGTVFYAAGRPAGRIEALEIPPRGGVVSAVVIETVEVRFTLVRAAATPECPARLTVSSVEVVPDTLLTREITWEF